MWNIKLFCPICVSENVNTGRFGAIRSVMFIKQVEPDSKNREKSVLVFVEAGIILLITSSDHQRSVFPETRVSAV